MNTDTIKCHIREIRTLRQQLQEAREHLASAREFCDIYRRQAVEQAEVLRVCVETDSTAPAREYLESLGPLMG